MLIFDFAWFQDFHGKIEELKSLAMPEDWDYKRNPLGTNPILENYIKHTFKKLEQEGKVLTQGDYAVFNTGLVTSLQEEIYAFFQNNKRLGYQPWFFVGWRKHSERDLMRFSNLPDVANYFTNPADLLYDTNIELRLNIDHIIEDNLVRFPPSYHSMDKYQIGTILQGTIDDAKRRIRRNYKTAVPQYYNGKIQLLLPLCLTSKAEADLALVVEKENGVYRASTCLTLDMAINNARLIAKPDNEWLKI